MYIFVYSQHHWQNCMNIMYMFSRRWLNTSITIRALYWYHDLIWHLRLSWLQCWLLYLRVDQPPLSFLDMQHVLELYSRSLKVKINTMNTLHVRPDTGLEISSKMSHILQCILLGIQGSYLNWCWNNPILPIWTNCSVTTKTLANFIVE